MIMYIRNEDELKHRRKIPKTIFVAELRPIKLVVEGCSDFQTLRHKLAERLARLESHEKSMKTLQRRKSTPTKRSRTAGNAGDCSLQTRQCDRTFRPKKNRPTLSKSRPNETLLKKDFHPKKLLVKFLEFIKGAEV
jgi:hypothetical protein